jgi:hypothetical protein
VCRTAFKTLPVCPRKRSESRARLREAQEELAANILRAHQRRDST